MLSNVMTNPLRTQLFKTLHKIDTSIEESVKIRGDTSEPMAQFPRTQLQTARSGVAARSAHPQ